MVRVIDAMQRGVLGKVVRTAPLDAAPLGRSAPRNDALQREEDAQASLGTGWRLTTASPVPPRATTLYGAVRVGRAGMVGSHAVWLVVAVAREAPMVRNEPIRGWVGRPERDARGPRWVARLVIVTEGETPMVRNDPMCGWVGRPERDARGPRWVARPVTVTVGETLMVRNDPIRGCVGRPERDARGPRGVAGGRGGGRSADGAQRPYTRLCGSAGARDARGRAGRRGR